MYMVSIVETLQTEVFINANSPEEAEKIARDGWKNEQYVLSADNFAGVEFDVEEV